PQPEIERCSARGDNYGLRHARAGDVVPEPGPPIPGARQSRPKAGAADGDAANRRVDLRPRPARIPGLEAAILDEIGLRRRNRTCYRRYQERGQYEPFQHRLSPE